MLGKFTVEPGEQIIDREIGERRMNGSGFELIDVEECIEHAGHASERFPCPVQQPHRLLIFDFALKCVVQKG